VLLNKQVSVQIDLGRSRKVMVPMWKSEYISVDCQTVGLQVSGNEAGKQKYFGWKP
jgi:hypothetical protein